MVNEGRGNGKRRIKEQIREERKTRGMRRDRGWK